MAAFSQKPDSVQQALYEQALQKLKSGDNSGATIQFTQLINTGFANKEIFVKRGIIFFQQSEFEKAKADFDEAVKGRINSAELFEYRGNAKYKLECAV